MNAFLLEPLTLCTSLGRAVSPALLGPDISGTFLYQRSHTHTHTHTHTHSLLSCIMIPYHGPIPILVHPSIHSNHVLALIDVASRRRFQPSLAFIPLGFILTSLPFSHPRSRFLAASPLTARLPYLLMAPEPPAV
ncbi:hypothetical protein DER44DRAFT_785178 [Fusarium oxysporum]|nr:hypothetical protein DER44DRAFT_785178 [Fusarium oxysporum]